MNIELIRKKFIEGKKVFCEKCKSEILVLGNAKTGEILSAQCSKNANHYSVILHIGKSPVEMFSDLPRKIVT